MKESRKQQSKSEQNKLDVGVVLLGGEAISTVKMINKRQVRSSLLLLMPINWMAKI